MNSRDAFLPASSRSENMAVRPADSAVLHRGRVGTPASVATEVVSGRRPPARRGFDQPRFLPVFTALVYVYLFAPIVIVFWFSFNSGRSLQVFKSFSLTWYAQLFNDQGIMASLAASVEIALVTMVVATTIGTLLAFGLVRARSRVSRPTDVLMLLNLVSPAASTSLHGPIAFSRSTPATLVSGSFRRSGWSLLPPSC